jgi:HSP20 family protein
MATNSQTPARSNRINNSLFYNPFDRLFRNDFSSLWNDNLSDTVPSINVTENKENYLVEMAAPGLKKEDFDVKMQGNLLTISCEKESQVSDGNSRSDNYWRREYNYSRFSRSITLPDNVESGKISAKYNDGILNLTIPKKAGEEKNSGQRIKVE